MNEQSRLSSIYRPLPHAEPYSRTRPFTRLLVLFAGSGDEDPFHGQLELIDLENPHTPRYEALSYTWGQEPENDLIWLHNNPLAIKPNLRAALLSLRLPNMARRLWIDAVCIDQSNVDERSRQVQYMRLVYKRAARVIVWLGLRTPGIEEAFSTAQRLSHVRQRTEATPDVATGGVAGPVSLTDVGGFARSTVEGTPEWSAMHLLSDLLERPYFERCWCIQEVVASSGAIAKCEDLEMSFFHLIGSSVAVVNWRRRTRNTPLQMWNIALTRLQDPGRSAVEGSIGKLLDLLDLTRALKATDPRDRIYSLLGISDEGIQPVLALTQIMGRESRLVDILRRGATRLSNVVNTLNSEVDMVRHPALMPDYSRDTVEVYYSLVRFLIRRSPRVLHVLSYVQHEADPESGPYPSWVPNWAQPKTCNVLQGSFLAGLCHGHFRYFAELHDCPLRGEPVAPRVLSLDGFQYDSIKTITDVVTFRDEEWFESTIEAFEAAWQQLFPDIAMTTGDLRYHDGEPMNVAFCRAALASPLGPIHASLMIQSATPFGVNTSILNNSIDLAIQDQDLQPRVQVSSFLNNLADLRSTPRPFPPQDNHERNLMAMGVGARHTLGHRRMFLTRDGRLGIGPKMMRPGDMVAVLFGGRMPFVVRPSSDHFVFVGDCYVEDHDLMWGDVCENVRFNRGGPPRFTFALH